MLKTLVIRSVVISALGLVPFVARPHAVAPKVGADAPARPRKPGAAKPRRGRVAPVAPVAAAPAKKYIAGEDPDFAARMGWPIKGPAPLPGAILPARRIVAYYGNPLSKQMGVLGQYEPQEMFRRFDEALDEWRKADPDTPVQPAFHLIAVVAQGQPGPSGKYRTIMRDSLIETVYGWAKARNAIMFIDIQLGQSDIREVLPRFDAFLSRPDMHLAIDPEFAMKTSGRVPGSKVGTLDAADVNYAAGHLAELVRKNNLPTKILIVHRFTRTMVTNASAIALRPEVQIIMNMDGWGAPWLKRDTYKDYIVREPVQYTGFKLFYRNDTKKGNPLLTPAEVLKLRPAPLYIQYQ
jgi:2-hydroxychromene-2-carboxylate isomerase